MVRDHFVVFLDTECQSRRINQCAHGFNSVKDCSLKIFFAKDLKNALPTVYTSRLNSVKFGKKTQRKPSE